MPMRIAIEMTPWDRIALRAGIQKNWFAEADSVVRTQSGTSNPILSENSVAIAEANGTANGVGLSFGLGIRLINNLTIDTVVRQTFFFDGPNFLGGRTPGVFAQGTLVYRFGIGAETDSSLKPLLNLDGLNLY